ncbi:hypothetical protein QYM36_002839 [Artemia franciscana]|uniref:Uncharacterized protein n=1 Tax=Artemia franciscana TaxID=6661 RepID=A0AA88I9H0_ARTSF|nr:hypothetical protein QYM36_002839 [Artemia franciscana]
MSVAAMKLDAIMTKSPREVLVEANQSNVVIVNNSEEGQNQYMLHPFLQVSKKRQEYLVILHSYLQSLEFVSKNEIPNNMELFKKIDTKTEMILREVFRYFDYARLLREHTKSLSCMLLKMLPKFPKSTDLSDYQQLLVGELTSLRREMKPSMYKFLGSTCIDYFKNTEIILWMVNKIRTKAKLIILVEDLKSLEGKQKLLTITCSGKDCNYQSKQLEIIHTALANTVYFLRNCNATEGPLENILEAKVIDEKIVAPHLKKVTFETTARGAAQANQ